MLNKQLKTFFDELFQKNSPRSVTEKTEKDSDVSELLNNLVLPEAIKLHLKTNGVTLTQFPTSYDFHTTTEMLKARVRSLLISFLETHQKEIPRKFLIEIQDKFNIETLREQKNFSLDKLKELLENFNKYVRKDMLVYLANLAKKPSDTVIKYEDENYIAFLEKLRKAEINNNSKVGRQSFVNIDENVFFYS